MEEDIYLDNRIYVLINGNYTWDIIGFTYSEDEAIKICLQENEKNNDNSCYYQLVNKIKHDGLTNIHPVYNYRINAIRINNEWIFQNKEDILIEYEYEMEYESSVKIDKVDYESNYDYSAIIYLSLDTLNRTKALKMAKDMLYEELAKKKEV